MFRKFTILLIIVLGIFTLSCNVYKISGTRKSGLKYEQLIDSINVNAIKYDHLSFKFSANISTNDVDESFSGVCRLAHDSIIWISLQKFNIEGVRVLIKPDSIFLLNRADKTLSSAGTVSFLSSIHPNLNFNFLQAIITNDIYLYNITNTSGVELKYDNCKSDSCYCLNSQIDLMDNMIIQGVDDTIYLSTLHKIEIVPEVFKVKNVELRVSPIESIFECEYSKFVILNNEIFPSLLSVFASSISDSLRVELDINRMKIESTQSYPFNVSSKYRRIKI